MKNVLVKNARELCELFGEVRQTPKWKIVSCWMKEIPISFTWKKEADSTVINFRYKPAPERNKRYVLPDGTRISESDDYGLITRIITPNIDNVQSWLIEQSKIANDPKLRFNLKVIHWLVKKHCCKEDLFAKFVRESFGIF